MELGRTKVFGDPCGVCGVPSAKCQYKNCADALAHADWCLQLLNLIVKVKRGEA